MDKYIKQLMVVISEKYIVNVITILSVSKNTGRATSIFKLIIKTKAKKLVCSKDYYSKQGLVVGMSKWLN